MGLGRAAVLLCAAFGLISGKAEDSVFSPEFILKSPGETALFNVSWDSPFSTLSWTYFDGLVPVVSVSGGVVSVNPIFGDHVNLCDNGSLELRNLTFYLRGDYTVNITSAEGPGLNAVFFLYVQEPVSDVRLSADATDLIEGHSVSLTCSASGSHLDFTFYNRSRVIHYGSDTLNLNFISRYSTGPFRCEAKNYHNRVFSQEVNFTFSYGPDDVILKTFPSKDLYPEGSNVTLQCTAVSSEPEAELIWRQNGETLPFNGTQLVLEKLTKEQDGVYLCIARNPKSKKDKSRSVTITVDVQVIPVIPKKILSDGAIAGLSITCVLVLVTAAAAFVCLKRK